jgi:hypothetical protein
MNNTVAEESITKETLATVVDFFEMMLDVKFFSHE